MRIEQEVRDGKHDDLMIQIETDDGGSQFFQVFTQQGMEEMGMDLGSMLNPGGANKRARRTVKVSDAMVPLTEEAMESLVDRGGIAKESIERAEQTGIIFLDEIDKVAMPAGEGGGPNVSREGVQRDLLPIIEGSTVQTKFGPVSTDHIRFVAAGAFPESTPSDLIPELQGRLPIRVHLESLNQEDFWRILTEPKNALTRQYQQLLDVEGVKLTFDESAAKELARYAKLVNERSEDIGARRLPTMLEKLLEDVMFQAPEIQDKSVKIDAQFVSDKLEPLIQDSESNQHLF